MQDVPAEGLRVGDIGVVVERHEVAGRKTRYGVEFFDKVGNTVTGFVNVVLWPPVFRRYAVLAKTARLLGVTGRLQVQAGVVHLIATQLWIPRLPQTPMTNASRDFH